MAKYKSAKPNEKIAEKKIVNTTVKSTAKNNRQKSGVMRIGALIFALLLLLSMAVIFPLQNGTY
ncbi:MAG: hypothetical protein LBL87_01715 [Ruminococcus sp.]|jgi:hypothetical protein|nr:hypothetical protein [Ruminococcus sp.]